jgi:hypothetical protein
MRGLFGSESGQGQPPWKSLAYEPYEFYTVWFMHVAYESYEFYTVWFMHFAYESYEFYTVWFMHLHMNHMNHMNCSV